MADPNVTRGAATFTIDFETANPGGFVNFLAQQGVPHTIATGRKAGSYTLTVNVESGWPQALNAMRTLAQLFGQIPQ